MNFISSFYCYHCFCDSILSACPELLEYSLQCNLFTPASGASNEGVVGGPIKMAEKFNVPYLGRLPMDPNLLNACENGKSFVEEYEVSPAKNEFQRIVSKIVQATETK